MGLSRRQREKRAYSLTLVSGGSAVAAVVFFVLAVIGVISLGWAVLAAIVAVGAAFLLRGIVKP
jgi:hypothetical protein